MCVPERQCRNRTHGPFQPVVPMPATPHCARRVFAVPFAIAFCLSLPGLALPGSSGRPSTAPPIVKVAHPPRPAAAAPQAEVCLATTMCALKDGVRWRTPPWSPSQCRLYAEAVEAAAEQHGLSPALILAVMLNESDLDEKAVSAYRRDGVVYAKDGGLMGIRCVFDQRGRCNNGFVKGMTFKNVMDPFTNIALGARELAYYRNGGGVEKRVIRVRGADGELAEKTRNVRCGHRTHAYWAHYNHGSRYIERGEPRHYPHRVAVLYYALAKALLLPVTELESGHLTIVDRGSRPRTADRPVEPRYRTLCSKIQAVSGVCRAPVTAASPAKTDHARRS